METVNGLLQPPRKPLSKENLLPHPSTKVDYHLNNLLALHLSKPDLTPQEIAEASTSAAATAAIAAKTARATADEKAFAAAKAVAAAKTALDLIASFPNQALVQEAFFGMDNMKKHVTADDEELPSKLQLMDVSQGLGLMPNSCSSCANKNSQCEVPIGLRERLDTEHAISKRVDFNGRRTELGSDRLIESGTKKEIHVTRKRGRPKSK